MAWEQLATETLGSNTGYIETSFDAKKWLYVYGQFIANGSSIKARITFDDDDSASYAMRRLHNGGSPANYGNLNYIEDMWNSDPFSTWGQVFILNNDSDATQVITNSANGDTAGAGNVPNYASMIGKWEDNTQATKIKFDGGGNDYATGTSITVIGTD